MEEDNLPLFCFMAKYTRIQAQRYTSHCASVSIPLVCPVWILMVSRRWVGERAWVWVLQCFLLWSTHQLSCFFLLLYLSGEGLCWACTLFQLCVLTHSHTVSIRCGEPHGDRWLQSAVERSHDISELQRALFTFAVRFPHILTHIHTLKHINSERRPSARKPTRLTFMNPSTLAGRASASRWNQTALHHFQMLTLVSTLKESTVLCSSHRGL